MLSLACALGSCTTSSSAASLEVLHNQAPAPDTCALRQDPGGVVIDHGTFDLSIGDRSSYVLTPVVRNRGSADVTLRSVHVRLWVTVEGERLQVSIMCSGGGACFEWDLDVCEGRDCPVVPGGGTASFEMPVLPRQVTSFYQAGLDAAVVEGRVPPRHEMQAELTLMGEAAGGVAVADPFLFDLTLCLGCLVDFPPGSDSPRLPGEDCCGDGPITPACYPGQDDPLDCRRCTRTLPEICNFGSLSCGS